MYLPPLFFTNVYRVWSVASKKGKRKSTRGSIIYRERHTCSTVYDATINKDTWVHNKSSLRDNEISWLKCYCIECFYGEKHIKDIWPCWIFVRQKCDGGSPRNRERRESARERLSPSLSLAELVRSLLERCVLMDGSRKRIYEWRGFDSRRFFAHRRRTRAEGNAYACMYARRLASRPANDNYEPRTHAHVRSLTLAVRAQGDSALRTRRWRRNVGRRCLDEVSNRPILSCA